MERDISRYLNLMFLFGVDFDVDPAHPWVADIINNETRYGGAAQRMAALYEEAAKHLPRREREPSQ
jgi:hypothetical protein